MVSGFKHNNIFYFYLFLFYCCVGLKLETILLSLSLIQQKGVSSTKNCIVFSCHTVFVFVYCCVFVFTFVFVLAL